MSFMILVCVYGYRMVPQRFEVRPNQVLVVSAVPFSHLVEQLLHSRWVIQFYVELGWTGSHHVDPGVTFSRFFKITFVHRA